MGLNRRLFFLCVLMLFLGPSVSPWPVPALDLDELTANATLIAVGEIRVVRETEKTTVQVGNRMIAARSMLATLRVDRTLKGSVEGPFLDFRFVVPDEFIGWRSVTPQSYRVFFLVTSPDGAKVSDPFYPSVVAEPAAETGMGTAIDRVIDELGAVVSSQRASDEQKREAVFELSSSKRSAAVNALKPAAEAKDPILRLTVSAALLGHNDISTLPFAENALLRPDPRLPPQLYLLHNLSSAISAGVTDEHAVPAMARLLRATSTETRRAAASALLHIGSTSCIDPLLLAIDDADAMVQYYGVVALAEITGQTDWRPNMDDFKSDPDKYLKHWHEWAQTR
jgi:hypothetical protein